MVKDTSREWCQETARRPTTPSGLSLRPNSLRHKSAVIKDSNGTSWLKAPLFWINQLSTAVAYTTPNSIQTPAYSRVTRVAESVPVLRKEVLEAVLSLKAVSRCGQHSLYESPDSNMPDLEDKVMAEAVDTIAHHTYPKERQPQKMQKLCITSLIRSCSELSSTNRWPRPRNC